MQQTGDILAFRDSVSNLTLVSTDRPDAGVASAGGDSGETSSDVGAFLSEPGNPGRGNADLFSPI